MAAEWGSGPGKDEALAAFVKENKDAFANYTRQLTKAVSKGTSGDVLGKRVQALAAVRPEHAQRFTVLCRVVPHYVATAVGSLHPHSFNAEVEATVQELAELHTAIMQTSCLDNFFKLVLLLCDATDNMGKQKLLGANSAIIDELAAKFAGWLRGTSPHAAAARAAAAAALAIRAGGMAPVATDLAPRLRKALCHPDQAAALITAAAFELSGEAPAVANVVEHVTALLGSMPTLVSPAAADPSGRARSAASPADKRASEPWHAW
ncbi:hypothetical protein ABPG75_000176 [Micractinium tetrahymenae]